MCGVCELCGYRVGGVHVGVGVCVCVCVCMEDYKMYSKRTDTCRIKCVYIRT